MRVPNLISLSALHFPGIFLWPDTHILWTIWLLESLLRRVWHLYTVLELIISGPSAMITANLSKSIMLSAFATSTSLLPVSPAWETLQWSGSYMDLLTPKNFKNMPLPTAGDLYGSLTRSMVTKSFWSFLWPNLDYAIPDMPDTTLNRYALKVKSKRWEIQTYLQDQR